MQRHAQHRRRVREALPSPLPKIRTDLAKLNQILFHLLDNAAKFTRRGRIELELALEDGQLFCSVTDTGIGIAPDDQEQIFDEFFRVDSSRRQPPSRRRPRPHAGARPDREARRRALRPERDRPGLALQLHPCPSSIT